MATVPLHRRDRFVRPRKTRKATPAPVALNVATGELIGGRRGRERNTEYDTLFLSLADLSNETEVARAIPVPEDVEHGAYVATVRNALRSLIEVSGDDQASRLSRLVVSKRVYRGRPVVGILVAPAETAADVADADADETDADTE